MIYEKRWWWPWFCYLRNSCLTCSRHDVAIVMPNNVRDCFEYILLAEIIYITTAVPELSQNFLTDTKFLGTLRILRWSKERLQNIHRMAAIFSWSKENAGHVACRPNCKQYKEYECTKLKTETYRNHTKTIGDGLKIRGWRFLQECNFVYSPSIREGSAFLESIRKIYEPLFGYSNFKCLFFRP